MNLLQFLSEAIHNYITAKSNLEMITDTKHEEEFMKASKEEAEWRTRLIVWITHARNCSIIKESESMTSKLKTYEKENNLLKEQVTNLRQLNEMLVRENHRLHNLVPDNQKDSTEVGDVE